MVVLQVKTGQEQNVRHTLLRKGVTAYVPFELCAIRCKGAWADQQRLLFPGYVFVDERINDHNYYPIKNTSSVICFLGHGQPSVISPEEETYIRGLSGSGQPVQPTSVRVLQNGEVEILDGILSAMSGRIVRFDKHSRKAILKIAFCGQEQEVKLSIHIVEDLRKRHS